MKIKTPIILASVTTFIFLSMTSCVVREGLDGQPYISADRTYVDHLLDKAEKKINKVIREK